MLTAHTQRKWSGRLACLQPLRVALGLHKQSSGKLEADTGMMTMKNLEVLLAGVIFFLFLGTANAEPQAHANNQALKAPAAADGQRFIKENALDADTAKLGDRLFFRIEKRGSFQSRYEKLNFGSGFTLASAIEAIRPKKEADGKLKALTIDDARPLALALYDMKSELTDGRKQKAAKILAEKSKLSPQAEFFKTIVDKILLKSDRPKEPELATLFDAFKKVEQDKQKEEAEYTRIWDSAGKNNLADKKKLWSDPKFGVSPETFSWLVQMSYEKSRDKVREGIETLGYDRGSFYELTGSYQGTPFTLEVNKSDLEQPKDNQQLDVLMLATKSPLLKYAQFKGDEHAPQVNAQRWVIDRQGKIQLKEPEALAVNNAKAEAGLKGSAIGVQSSMQ